MPSCRSLVLVGFVFAWNVGCGSSQPPPNDLRTGNQGVSAPPSSASAAPVGAPEGAGGNDEACETDSDCVAVEMACCDHCNGGSVAAFHRDHADKHRKKGCEEVMCTMRACGEAVAKCEQHRCKASVVPLHP